MIKVVSGSPGILDVLFQVANREDVVMFGAVGQRIERNARNLNDMMARVGLDPETAPEFGMDFAAAMQRCLWCSASAECEQWLASAGAGEGSPPGFCPNASFFARSALATRGAPKSAAAMRTLDEKPDENLPVLYREWASAAAEYDASTLALDAAEEKLEEIDAHPPEALFEQAGDRALGLPAARRHDSGRLWYGPIVAGLRGLVHEQAHELAPEVQARIREILAAHDTWLSAREAAEEISVVTAARDRAACERVDALLGTVVSTPASTLEGVRQKAVVAVWAAGGIGPLEVGLREAGQIDVALTMSIVRDLLALAPAKR